jgi:hypothetical protein
LKSLLLKTVEEELRSKYDIQNYVPQLIEDANMAFQSSLEIFIGVDELRYALSTFPVWHFSAAISGPFLVLVLARFE